MNTIKAYLQKNRPTAPMPKWATYMLTGCFALQLMLTWNISNQQGLDRSPGRPPQRLTTTVFSLGEAPLSAYAMNIYIQTFDSQAEKSLGIRTLDHSAIRQWLSQAIEINPKSIYSLLLASRVYASAANPADARKTLDFVHEHFLRSPKQNWPWLAHAVHVARYELGDMELAKRYARSIALHATLAEVPSWAKQLEVFILEANNEIDAARQLLGNLINSGQIKDLAELQFLAGRLNQLNQGVSK
jgi:hypothetical protein